jgi:hypothetical protein
LKRVNAVVDDVIREGFLGEFKLAGGRIDVSQEDGGTERSADDAFRTVVGSFRETLIANARGQTAWAAFAAILSPLKESPVPAMKKTYDAARARVLDKLRRIFDEMYPGPGAASKDALKKFTTNLDASLHKLKRELVERRRASSRPPRSCRRRAGPCSRSGRSGCPRSGRSGCPRSGRSGCGRRRAGRTARARRR